VATNMRDAICLKVYVELQFCIQLYQWGDAIDVWEGRRTEKVRKPWSKSLVTLNFTFISSFKIKCCRTDCWKKIHFYSYWQKRKESVHQFDQINKNAEEQEKYLTATGVLITTILELEFFCYNEFVSFYSHGIERSCDKTAKFKCLLEQIREYSINNSELLVFIRVIMLNFLFPIIKHFAKQFKIISLELF